MTAQLERLVKLAKLLSDARKADFARSRQQSMTLAGARTATAQLVLPDREELVPGTLNALTNRSTKLAHLQMSLAAARSAESVAHAAAARAEARTQVLNNLVLRSRSRALRTKRATSSL